MAAKLKMYNAGDRIKEPLNYSIPDTYGDIHAVARWELDAPAGSFFFVPTELKIDHHSVRVHFAQDIARKFGHRGVILIDEDEYGKVDVPEDQPFVATDAEAEQKGKALWRSYLEEIVRVHLDTCAEARARGGAPRPAVGFTKRALKLLNQSDPGENIFNDRVQTTAITSPEVTAMSEQVKAMAAMMDELKRRNESLMATIKAQSAEKTDALLDKEDKASKKSAGK